MSKEKTRRLFLGIDLPEPLRHELAEKTAWMSEFPDFLKIVFPQNFHSTLFFIGGVSEVQSREIQCCLKEKTKSSSELPMQFSMTLGSWGAFPSKKKPQVFWISAEPEPQLAALAQFCTNVLSQFKLPTPAQPFRPHITVARAKKLLMDKTILDRWNSMASWQSGRAEAVSSFVLFESHLVPQAPKYIKLAQFSLISN